MSRVNRGLIVAFVLLQVVTSVAFPSLIRNEIICDMVHAQTSYSVHLESGEDTGASLNKGTTTINSQVHTLPKDLAVSSGSWIEYSPATGYGFLRWETTGGVFVDTTSYAIDVLNVTGSGTLRAIYTAGGIRLESAQNTGATTNKGILLLLVGHNSVQDFPKTIYLNPGSYPISYQLPTGYTFVGWEATGSVSVSSSTSKSTTLNVVTGSGTLRAIYTAGGNISLESVQDNGASSNKGYIVIDPTAYGGLPTDVTKPPAVYSISYSAESGYIFVRWETVGSMSVSNPTSVSTSLTVTGPGTLRAIYATVFAIHLESVQDNGVSSNKGTIALSGAVSTLPMDTTKLPAVYATSYSPASGYIFVRWETVGSMSVSNPTSVSTSLTVTGPGTLRAIYIYGTAQTQTTQTSSIRLESVEDTGASKNKGSITLDGAVLSLPTDVTKPPAVYSVSYSPASGYAFVRWETLGGVSVSSSTSVSTSLTVTGPGKLKAIYSITPQTLYRIDLKSGEDGGTTSNAGRITFAAVAYSQLPAQVSKVAGSYSISYTPATGYIFVRWQASGAIVVTQSSSQSTTAKVTGQGTLTAVYRKGVVHRQPLPFGVALSLEPDKQSVQAGQSASFKINVQLVYGSAPAVSLEVTDHPGNANYSFSMPSGTPPYSSDLTISTDPSTPPGTYMCTVTCSALDELDSTSVTLIVEGFKSPSQLSVTTKPNTLEEGESVTVTGSLVPYMSATVQLVYRNPGGAEITRQVSTDTGNFTDTFKPDAAGDWSVKAKWVGDSDFEGSESSLARFSVKASPLTIALPVAAVVVVSVAAALFFYLRKKRLH